MIYNSFYNAAGEEIYSKKLRQNVIACVGKGEEM